MEISRMRLVNVIVSKMDVAQSASFIQSMTYEAGIVEYEDFPRTEEPVWILGRQYSALYDLDDIKADVKSRLWFTYRKGFAPIGGQGGPAGDTGWGCMLRCGQMMLAQALIDRHLSRDWRWQPDKYDPRYHEILRIFQDKRSCCYSIHQIASMGASEGKAVGQWFGPNTIAQVLKKLAVYDEWSSVAIHVAMDNTVITEDIKTLCRCQCDDCKGRVRTSRVRDGSPNKPNISNGVDADTEHEDRCKGWKPLLLIIPLRLGLSDINPVYINSLRTCFTFSQSVGIIGGKPNHAHWFIGTVEDELLYLDPHVTQLHVDLSNQGETDESFHCPYICRLKIQQLDPSIALGFFCDSEAEFDDWCISVKKFIITSAKTPMFEVYNQRPAHWPAFQPYTPSPAAKQAEAALLDDRLYDTDEEFELL